jgi:hypothetical protein
MQLTFSSFPSGHSDKLHLVGYYPAFCVCRATFRNPLLVPPSGSMRIRADSHRPRRCKQRAPKRRPTNSERWVITQKRIYEANCSSSSPEIPRILWNLKIHYRIHKSPPPVPILSLFNPVYTSHLFQVFCSGLRTKTLWKVQAVNLENPGFFM